MKKKHVKTTKIVAGHRHHKLEEPPKPRKGHHVHHKAHKKGILKQYIGTWKEVKSFSFIMLVLFDLLFYALMYPLFYGYGYFIDRFAAPFQSTDLGALAGSEQLAMYEQSLAGLIVFVFLLSLAFSLLFILIWSLSRAFIWTRLLGKKITGKYIGKFYLLNVIWIVGWVIFFIIYGVLFYKIASASKAGGIITGIIFVLLFITMVYFMYIMYYRFTMGENRIWRSLKEAFVLGTIKCPRLTLPVIMVLGTIVIAALFSISFKLLPKLLMDILSYILFFGVFAWVKVYGVDVLREKT